MNENEICEACGKSLVHEDNSWDKLTCVDISSYYPQTKSKVTCIVSIRTFVSKIPYSENEKELEKICPYCEQQFLSKLIDIVSHKINKKMSSIKKRESVLNEVLNEEED